MNQDQITATAAIMAKAQERITLEHEWIMTRDWNTAGAVDIRASLGRMMAALDDAENLVTICHSLLESKS
jgi:hypothetical protein